MKTWRASYTCTKDNQYGKVGKVHVARGILGSCLREARNFAKRLEPPGWLLYGIQEEEGS